MRITYSGELCELTELFERFIVRPCCCGDRHQRARHLAFEISGREFKIKGLTMTFTMPPLNAAGAPSTVTVIGSPVTGQINPDGTPVPSKATLSNVAYTSSDPTVGTVAVDPATSNGAIITAVANPPAGTTASFTLTETATATELDGTTTEVITGVATIILSASVVPPAPAAALTFTFGTPA